MTSAPGTISAIEIAKECGVNLIRTSELRGLVMAKEIDPPALGTGSESKWGASKIASNQNLTRLVKLREQFCIPYDIELLTPYPEERACSPRSGCVAISEHLLKAGFRLPLHPFFRAVLRLYGLAPTQLVPNAWSQLVGSYFLWKETSLGEDMPLHILQTLLQPRSLGKGDSRGWYSLCPWGSHSPFVVELPSSIKGWRESWFWVRGKWQEVEGDTVPHVKVPTSYSEASECQPTLECILLASSCCFILSSFI